MTSTLLRWCSNRLARATFAIVLSAALTQFASSADDKTTSFNAYADSELCAHLMLGPISEQRITCSKDTHKQGAAPVLVRIEDNLVFSVNKTKMLDPLVSQMVSATGEAKEKDGRIKLASVIALPAGAITPGSPGAELLDVRHFRLTGEGAEIHEKVRHELATMPYVGEYDFISFTMADRHVILTGWTVRQTNRNEAYNLAKRVKGVETVTNNIEVLPLGRMDMQARSLVRAKLQRVLARYFWGGGSAIRIIVKNGNVILLGVVASKSDSDLAYMQSNSVTGVFRVFNMLKVEQPTTKAAR